MKPSVVFSLSVVAAGFLSFGVLIADSSAQHCLLKGSEPKQTDQRVKESSELSFNKDVLEASKPVLVDFYATWCGPCKRMAPVVEGLSRTYNHKIATIRVDVDNNPELAAQYNINSIPALKLFKNGRIVDEAVGVTSAAELSSKIDRALAL